MKKLSALILIVSSLYLGQAFQLFVLQQNAQNELEQALKSKTLIQDFSGIYFNYEALVYSNSSAANSLKTNICNKLKEIDAEDAVLGREQKYYIFRLNTAAKCGLKLSSDLQRFINLPTSNEQLIDIYRSTILGFEYSQFESGLLEGICNKALEYLDKEGSVRNLKRKADSSSYENSAYVLELLEKCIQNSKNNQKYIKQVISTSANLMENVYPIYRGALSFIEGESHIVTTAEIAYFLEVLSQNISKDLKSYQSNIGGFATFFSQVDANSLTPRERAALARISSVYKNYPLINTQGTVKHPNAKGSSNLYELPFEIKNLLDQSITIPKDAKLKCDVLLDSNTLEAGRIAQQKPNQDYKIDVEINKVKEPGVYVLRCNYNQNQGTLYQLSIKYTVYTDLILSDLKFDIVQSKKEPQIYRYQTEQGKQYQETLEANQNSFIHVRFRVQVTGKSSAQVQFAGVRLTSQDKQLQYTTNIVEATFNGETQYYSAVIDLGDPDHILAYNGNYDLELVVGDELTPNTIRQNIARVSVNFGKQEKLPPVNDATYQLLPEIQHSFPSERRKPATLITLAFLGFIGVAFIIYLVLLGKLNLNFSRFPSDPIVALKIILFLVCVFSILGLLVLFWVKFNLAQTATYLSILLVPTVLIGNSALGSLARIKTEENEKEKEN